MDRLERTTYSTTVPGTPRYAVGAIAAFEVHGRRPNHHAESRPDCEQYACYGDRRRYDRQQRYHRGGVGPVGGTQPEDGEDVMPPAVRARRVTKLAGTAARPRTT